MTRLKLFFLSQIVVIIFLGIIFSIFGIPNFGNGGKNISENPLNDRILKNQNEKISFTGSVISEKNIDNGEFIVQNLFGKKFIAISKNLDLGNYLQEKNLDKKIFFEGEIFFDKKGEKFFDVKKISEIEEKKNEEPKIYFLKNKFGGYGFNVNEKIFKAVKGGSKTILKNGSGEIILKFFSYNFSGKGNFFSDGGSETNLNGINGEIRALENGEEIFLKNLKDGYGVLIEVNYGTDLEKIEITKKQVYDFLQGFKFIKKENISSKKCGGKENILCEEGYFCELFSISENASGRCVELNKM